MIDLKQLVSTRRTHFMGWAMILVWIYHFFLYTYNPIGPLSRSIGVDVFLFLSGFGLFYSYNKNTISKFYYNRYSKILFLFIILCLSISYIDGKGNLIGYLITYNYWTGQKSADWYLSFIISLYWLFPFFIRFVNSFKFKSYFLSLLFSTIALLVLKIMGNGDVGVYWRLECGISRIPIFILGIIFAQVDISKQDLLRQSIMSIVIFTPLALFLSPTIAFSLFTLFYIYILSKIPNNIILNYIGNHTLEIYVANIILEELCKKYSGILLHVILFTIGQFILSAILIFLNYRVHKFLKL